MNSFIFKLTAALMLAAGAVAAETPEALEIQTPEAVISIESSMDSNNNNEVSFGESIHIEAGEVHEGDLVIFGGSASIDGRVTGDVVVFGGSVSLAGEVDGDAVVFGGSMNLDATAVVKGGVVAIGGSLHRDDAAKVGKEIVTVGNKIWISELIKTLASDHRYDMHFQGPTFDFLPLFNLISFIWWGIISLLLVIFLGRNVESAGETLKQQTFKSLVAGVAFGFIALVLLIGFTITIIGLPLTFVLFLFCVGLYIFSVPVGFIAIGKGLMELFGRSNTSLIASAAIGWILLFLIRLIPFGLGLIIWSVWIAAAVGAALISKFGMNTPWWKHRYTGYPAPPPPPAPPSDREGSDSARNM
jgi:hypothetical protein